MQRFPLDKACENQPKPKLPITELAINNARSKVLRGLHSRTSPVMPRRTSGAYRTQSIDIDMENCVRFSDNALGLFESDNCFSDTLIDTLGYVKSDDVFCSTDIDHKVFTQGAIRSVQ